MDYLVRLIRTDTTFDLSQKDKKQETGNWRHMEFVGTLKSDSE